MRAFAVLLAVTATASLVYGAVNHRHSQGVLDMHGMHAAHGKAVTDPVVADAIKQISAMFEENTRAQFNAGDRGGWLRQAHPKGHGCAVATVHPTPGLSANLAAGIFGAGVAPADGFKAFIRFSNGVGKCCNNAIKASKPDALPDIRGLGLKIVAPNLKMSADAPAGSSSQVFTFTTSSTYFTADAKESVEFFKAIHSGLAGESKWLATHIRQANLFLAGNALHGHIPDLLGPDWFSAVPQNHGNLVVRHKLYPCTDAQRQKGTFLSTTTLSFNGLAENLKKDLAADSACFKWAVQFHDTEKDSPLLDATIDWTTPYTDIATVTLPKQSLWTPAQSTFCDWMTFNPGMGLAEHEPVGQIMQIREAVYASMATLRHGLMGQSKRDVTVADYDAWVAGNPKP